MSVEVAAPPAIRLTELAHGGGCGCKLAPSVLRPLLTGAPAFVDERLLVGSQTSDDAAVWRLDAENCVISTTDFFTPIVDDPYDFGRIAATNALSDIYAMGGSPIMALAIVGMPVNRLPLEAIRAILAGGAAACAEAGTPVAGGHSIDCAEPIYGLAVTGLCKSLDLKRNSTAQAGDALILTKPLGVGVYSAALRKNALSSEAYRELIGVATTLNRLGAALAREPGVHAMTDVTGFGLCGHLLEMARGAGLSARLDAGAVPLMREAQALAEAGCVTGASARNFASDEKDLSFSKEFPHWLKQILTDPQTSGGLLISCAKESAQDILEQARETLDHAEIIGAFEPGPARLFVEGT